MCIFSLMGTPASYQQESSTTIVPVGKQSTRFPKSILVPPKESITAKTHISGFQRSALYVFMSCRIARRHVSQHSTVSPVETNQLIWELWHNGLLKKVATKKAREVGSPESRFPCGTFIVGGH